MNRDKKRLERLEQKIYSRNYKDPDNRNRAEFERGGNDLPETWQDEESVMDLIRQKRSSHSGKPILKKILVVSIIFFILSVGVAAFMFFGGINTVSSGNIDIRVFGPTTIGGGEELSLEITVANKNNADLEGAVLQIEYPAGARVAGNITEELLRQREVVGSIDAGGEAKKIVRSVLFGEKESIKEIVITLEYRIKGSSALLYKEKRYDLAIKSSPIIMTVDYPSEVTSGADIDFILTINSNTAELLRNLLVRVEYPFGFSFVEADPQPVEGDYLWRVGDLPTGEKRTVRIRGSLQGQNEEERTFRFVAGIENDKEPNKIAADFVMLSESITIKRPFLDLVVTIAGDSSKESVARPGERIQANIVWTNNLPAPVLDAKIEVQLSGIVFDRSSVQVSRGFYRSVDNTIIWDKTTSGEFAQLEPGERGAVSFSFASLSNLSSALQNQQIDVSITMSGNQILENNRPQMISSNEGRVVKIASNLSVAARTARSIGPLENSGPIPPKADNETTYTVIWTVTNSFNDITNTTVRATLPTYISWGELSHPAGEKVTYNPISREVIWSLGDVAAGTGFSTSPREVAFQIKFLPSLNQVGTSPMLLGETRITGEDRFTGRIIDFKRGALTTQFNTDPAFKLGDETVVK
jgi:hypothetical protein